MVIGRFMAILMITRFCVIVIAEEAPFTQASPTALVGPSGYGKTTYLRCFNRIHDLYPGNRYEGEVLLYPDRVNIVGPDVDPIEVRMRIGMVFQ